MFQALKQMFVRGADRPPAAIPPGQRVYAVGDIHGRRDLFEALVAAIEADDARCGSADTTVVLLGDLVDRGADSAGVIDSRAAGRRDDGCASSPATTRRCSCAASTNSKCSAISCATAAARPRSATGSIARRSPAELEEAQQLMRTVPAEDVAFLESFEDLVTIGDYLFVHAGIDPRVPLDAQRRQDLRWIREPFLSHAERTARWSSTGTRSATSPRSAATASASTPARSCPAG